MNRSWVFRLVAGLLLIALVVSGCTTSPQEDDEIVVAFSGAPLLDDFQIQLKNGLQDKADELGVTLLHVENGNDPVKQASDIEDLLAQDIDALLVTAANADAIIPSIEQATEQGIPVFTIDNASNSPDVLNHSGNDLFCIGYRSLEYLSEQLGDSGKILHINGFPGMALVTWNDDGVQAYLADNPGLELVGTQYGDWDPAKAQSITEDALTTNPDLAGIYVISEVMTGGVVQALAAQGLTDQIKVMSGGFAPESQEWLTNGEIAGTFEWSSYTGAQEQMQRIYDYLVSGTEPPPFSAWPVTGHPAEGDTFQLDCPIGDWTPTQ
jgi:ribose transport system substrate-binding protein